jgi:Tfp pilus assembly protein FimT
MVVIAITAIVVAFAVPNMLGWRENSKFNGTVENLRGDLNLAKIMAVRENGFVAVQFLADGYQVFTDNGPISGVLDAGERLLRNRVLPAGVAIDLGMTDFTSDRTRFNERGLPENIGTVVIVGTGGDQRSINLNRLGRIDVQ